MNKAKETIAKLKSEYQSDRFAFELVCSTMISGNQNKKLRVEIMEELKGEKLPATKCSFHLVCDELKASTEQFKMDF